MLFLVYCSIIFKHLISLGLTSGFDADFFDIEADGPLSVLARTSEQKFKEDLSMDAVKKIAEEMLKKDAPIVEIGSTVNVHVRIKEGERERIQVFEGTVIAKNNSGIAETFTVRRVSYGVGVERVFPLHSPNVAKVELVRRGRVRRAKLYYLRDRVGKAAKVKELIG